MNLKVNEASLQMPDLVEIKKIIYNCLSSVYNEVPSLVEKYDICERSIMHRLALYLQKIFEPEYFVDCEFDKMENHLGEIEQKRVISDKNYIDIIIHKRGNGRDFLCFELKKEDGEGIEDDRSKLKILTSCKPGSFQYKYGFLIVLTKNFEDIKLEIYQNGVEIEYD